MPKRQAKKRLYSATEEERAVVNRYLSDETARPSARFKVNGGKLVHTHPVPAIGEVLLMQELGIKDGAIYQGLLSQLKNISYEGGKPNPREMNFLLAVIQDIRPRNQIEVMLATQMAAVHTATMSAAYRLNNASTLPHADHAERVFNKLARTFTAQMEALKRFRSAGEQIVAVQHVSVNQGGQAIVGNVTQATPSLEKEKPGPDPCLITDAKTIPMPVLGESAECEPAAVEEIEEVEEVEDDDEDESWWPPRSPSHQDA